jgi:hypothetical protein
MLISDCSIVYILCVLSTFVLDYDLFVQQKKIYL